MPESPEAFAAHLDRKVAEVLHGIATSDVYRTMTDPQNDPRLLAALLKYVLLEVFSYGPHVTEATFTAIGRMPKTRPDLMKPMILHDLEEVDHGEMALRDFIKLGGDEDQARRAKISPAAFALGATCRFLATSESPFAYLGYMYLFETLTPVLAEGAQALLKAKGAASGGQHFIEFHATADVGHSRALRELIVRVVQDFPEAAEAIDYGFDCFASVYPLPIWRAALQNAQKELGS